MKRLIFFISVVMVLGCNTTSRTGSSTKGGFSPFGKADPEKDDCSKVKTRRVEPTDKYIKDGLMAAQSWVLSSNVNAWYARWRLLEKAQENILVQYYILGNDHYGKAILGKLIEKAEKGVDVYLMLDLRGSGLYATVFRDYLQEAVEGGVKVKIFNPTTTNVRKIKANFDAVMSGIGDVLSGKEYENILSEFLTLNQTANHDKILQIDDRMFITGGRNLSASYYGSPDKDPKVYDDLDILVKSRRASKEISKVFFTEFNHSYNRLMQADTGANIISRREELMKAKNTMDQRVFGNKKSFSLSKFKNFKDYSKKEIKITGRSLADMDKFIDGPEVATDQISVLDNTALITGKRCGLGLEYREADNVQITLSVLWMIANATQDIIIFNPYVIFTDDMHKAVEAAGRRGHKVSIITNSPLSTDSMLSQAAFLAEWKNLMRRHPNLDIYVAKGPQKLHGKTFLFNDTDFILGSFNLDPMSFYINSEDAVFVRSSDRANYLRGHLEDFMKKKTIQFKRVGNKLIGLEQFEKDYPHYKEEEAKATRFIGLTKQFSKRL